MLASLAVVSLLLLMTIV